MTSPIPPPPYPTAALDSALANITSAGDKNQQLDAATSSLSAFEHAGSILLQALDIVQEVHPFVKVAVSAFKAAYELNKTRHDNDKKIDLVFSKIASMMGVLADMRDIADPQATNTHRYNQFRDKLETVAREIKDCSAVCDTYSQQKFLKKTFAAKSWDKKFIEFFDLFDRRRVELHQDLSVFVAADMRHVATAMRVQRDRTNRAELFRQLEHPKLREMTKFVNAKGGAAAFLATTPEGERLFRELQTKLKGADDDNDTLSDPRKQPSAQALKSEIRKCESADIEKLLEKDRQGFDRKFDAMKDKPYSYPEYEDKLDKMKVDIIEAIRAGAHDKLTDNDVRQVWQDMGWKGSVKARHLVAALSDFYQQKYGRDAPNNQGSQEDAWVTSYIELSRTRPIVEAIDSDSSGWVTVREANAFAASRPEEFTVTMWIAYWAAGFRVICLAYAEEIQDMRAMMGQLALRALPSNQRAVDSYLSEHSLYIVDQLVHGIITSADESDERMPMNLVHRFHGYKTSEKEYLTNLIERLHWEIDAQNSLSIITGGGRIEQFIFPLLSLLLTRHLEILKLAATVKLSEEELEDASITMSVLMSSVVARFLTIYRGLQGDEETDELKYYDLPDHADYGSDFDARSNADADEDEDDENSEEPSDRGSDYASHLSILRYPYFAASQDGKRRILHMNCECDRCGNEPLGPRFRCIECKGPSIFQGIDLCGRCVQRDVYRDEDDLHHEESHDILRTMRVIYDRDLARILDDASIALKRAKDDFVTDNDGDSLEGDGDYRYGDDDDDGDGNDNENQYQYRDDDDDEDENRYADEHWRPSSSSRALPSCVLCQTSLQLPF
ncbi:hypothetical protein EXIGLDRAFT_767390 [Exidia glandulosa HHB12029]|uniref:ZZ-type domain-containing protein n=1 Tax=Exidia glandulosa HHB12029 TaxID=1314781 RepID=A0A165IZD3_EXIGL|nr:hypothetical protein EXIGLDRAFT_767390 [Exidia glandulosa HHB12029]